MFHNNDSQLVVNLECKLVKKELAFMITKTLFMRCYSTKCDLILDSVQRNIMHYIISGKIIHIPKVSLNQQTNIIAHF